MHGRQRSKKFVYGGSIAAFALVAVVLWQNCSDVRLHIPYELLSSGTKVSGVLAPPLPVRNHTRLVFVVDHSYSMLYQKCSGDLDSDNPSPRPQGCNPVLEPNGDAKADRYTIIKQWLQDMKDSEEPDLKVLILPFSGGVMDQERKRREAEKLEFLPVDEAIARLDDLKKEQEKELANPNLGVAEKRMGTTVPLGFISIARAKIQAEMNELIAMKELHSSAFELYFISDGQYTPHEEDILKGLELAECPKECALSPELVSCDPPQSGYIVYPINKPKILQTLTPDQKAKYELCKADSRACACLTYAASMYEYFGRGSDNDEHLIRMQLVTTSKLAAYFGEGRLDAKFVRVTQDQSANPQDELKIYSDLMKAPLANLPNMSAIPPRKSPSLSHLSFKIDDFYAVNLNAIATPDGRFVADSDADGLSDQQEMAFGSDPLIPRSGRDDDGTCLDGIRFQFGCRTSGCEAKVDRDNDGLNECEEMTLKTSSEKRDSGDDGIFDYLKLLKGHGPLLNSQVEDSNSDSFTDEASFKLGYPPTVDIRMIPTERRLNPLVEFLGYKDAGALGSRPAYRIVISNIPLVETREVTFEAPIFYDRLQLDPIPKSHSVGNFAQAAGKNQIIFLLRLRAMEDENLTYWLLWRGEMPYGHVNKLELDLSDFVELRKMGWEL